MVIDEISLNVHFLGPKTVPTYASKQKVQIDLGPLPSKRSRCVGLCYDSFSANVSTLIDFCRIGVCNLKRLHVTYACFSLFIVDSFIPKMQKFVSTLNAHTLS